MEALLQESWFKHSVRLLSAAKALPLPGRSSGSTQQVCLHTHELLSQLIPNKMSLPEFANGTLRTRNMRIR